MISVEDLAVVLLASGLSRRFGREDKLLATLDGKPLLSHAATLVPEARLRLAVCPADNTVRQNALRQKGWKLVSNPNPSEGQGRSLGLAMTEVAQSKARAVLILLADMPFITRRHINDLLASMNQHDAAMSIFDSTLMPPAIFGRATFAKLTELAGDKGARNVFKALPNTATCELTNVEACDIDTPADLAKYVRGTTHV